MADIVPKLSDNSGTIVRLAPRDRASQIRLSAHGLRKHQRVGVAWLLAQPNKIFFGLSANATCRAYITKAAHDRSKRKDRVARLFVRCPPVRKPKGMY